MVSGHDEDSQLARALAGGKPYPTGWFRLYFEDERWEWSPEVEQLHGYEPGTAQPTTSMRIRSRAIAGTVAMLVELAAFVHTDKFDGGRSDADCLTPQLHLTVI